MKKLIPLILFLTAVFALYAEGGKDKPVPAKPVEAPAVQTPPPNPWFSGDGGRELSLAVLVPEGKSLAADQSYLPALVQGVFVSDFAKYSGIQVLDRQNLEKILVETESGIYADEDFLKLGEIHIGQAMTGSVTKTASGYALQIQVAPTSAGANAVTLASYSATCTAEELDNFTAIKKASLELLSQMGVNLTDRAKAELSGAAAANEVDGQTALAQGITAQRGGSEVQALAYYMSSANYDPNLIEAASRLNVLSADITSGGVRENAQNDIEWRRQWMARLKECEDFIASTIRNNPLCAYTIVGSPLNLADACIDYATETMSTQINLTLNYKLLPQFDVLTRVIQQVQQGLEATGRARTWGLSGWPSDTQIYAVSARGMFVELEVLNESGKLLARETTNFPVYWCIFRDTIQHTDTFGKTIGITSTVAGAILQDEGPYGSTDGFKLLQYLETNGSYKWCDYKEERIAEGTVRYYTNVNAQDLWNILILEKMTYGRNGKAHEGKEWDRQSEKGIEKNVYFRFNVNDITDKMTVRVSKIGMSDGSFRMTIKVNNNRVYYTPYLIPPPERNMLPADRAAAEMGITILMGNGR
jgi:hypothetical protein